MLVRISSLSLQRPRGTAPHAVCGGQTSEVSIHPPGWTQRASGLGFREKSCKYKCRVKLPCVSRKESKLMSYHVVAFTLAQVRQGALAFQRRLGAILRESKDLKVYSASPFDLDERRRLRERFGGDVVYFFNDAALQECARLSLDLLFIAEVPDSELPRRRALVVGIPE